MRLRFRRCSKGARLRRRPLQRESAEEQPLAGFLAGRDLSGLTCAGPLELGTVPNESRPEKLTLGELEALARALLSVLLAFLHA